MGKLIGKLLVAKAFIDRITKVRTFRRQCRNPMKVQRALLKEILNRRKDTEFGQQYHFSEIEGIEEYRQRVPVHRWEDMLPYMERVWEGKYNVLIPRHDPMVMYAETSGTTGKPKLIPVTKYSYQLYGESWDLHWSYALKESPGTFCGKIFYFPGDPEEGQLGGIPYGAISGRAYIKQRWPINTLYAYPYQVAKIEDYDVRYYTILRMAIEQDISHIGIANPSTILKLFCLAQDRHQDIIYDIQNGNLRYADKIPEEVRKKLLEKIRPNAKRARELESIYRRTGDFLPRDYWKGLSTITCFSSGPLKLYIPEIEEFIDAERVRIFDFGILASEGRFSFPLHSQSHGDGCCLTINSNFYEFIPEDQINEPNPRVLTLNQVEEGKNYFIIITSASGLYRYNISDMIKVTGFYENVPMITFCNKGKNMSSITGEKLCEFQVTESVRRASERTGYQVNDFIVCLHWDSRMPYYSLIMPPAKGYSPKELLDFIATAEEELMRMNTEYRAKRKSGRLGPLTLKTVTEHGYEDFEDNRQHKCHNLSQYKHTFLISDPKFEVQFTFCDQVPSRADPGLV